MSTEVKAHGFCSPSASGRWLNCTMAPTMEAKFENKPSAAAEEGTVAHAVAETVLRFKAGQILREDYDSELARISKSSYYTEDMLEDCTAYADRIIATLEDVRKVCLDASLEVEQKVNLSRYIPDGFGTADAVIVAEPILYVFDFKYGKGHRVEAYENPQMKTYALGVLDAFSLLYDVGTVRMAIVQPRLSNGFSEYEMSAQELLDWGENVLAVKAKAASSGTGEFAPDAETCKFCRARGACTARAQKLVDLFNEHREEVPGLLTTENAGELLSMADDIKAWLSDLESYVFGKLMTGEAVPGWKLVEGRSVRRFKSPADVAKTLLDAGYQEALIYKPRELITLTQMEKDFGKKAVAELLGGLIEKPAGKPTIAAASDKRAQIFPAEAILSAFDD